MKSQVHNDGELRELNVKIEKDVVDAIERMAEKSGISIDELVVVALKRFRASHSDYEGRSPSTD